MSDQSEDVGGEGVDWPPGLAPLASTQPLKGGFICSTIRGPAWPTGGRWWSSAAPTRPRWRRDGLAALAAAGAPVPAVLGAAGHVLVLERVGGPPDWPGLGRAVARGCTAPTGDRFGWHRDNFQGLSRPAQRLE